MRHLEQVVYALVPAPAVWILRVGGAPTSGGLARGRPPFRARNGQIQSPTPQVAGARPVPATRRRGGGSGPPRPDPLGDLGVPAPGVPTSAQRRAR
jgi:hypothetical protein